MLRFIKDMSTQGRLDQKGIAGLGLSSFLWMYRVRTLADSKALSGLF
jgi:hypothetical protein